MRSRDAVLTLLISDFECAKEDEAAAPLPHSWDENQSLESGGRMDTSMKGRILDCSI